METITEFQNNLLKQIKNEFERLNPKPMQTDSPKKFTLETIENSFHAKEVFLNSLKEYNKTMIKMLEPKFNQEIENVRKEFSKYIDVRVGVNYGSYQTNDYEKIKEEVEDKGSVANTKEIYIFFVSKTKKSNYGVYITPMGYQQYYQLYCKIKNQREQIILDSGEKIYFDRVADIEFCNVSWHSDSTKLTNKSLYGLINETNSIQISLTNLCK